MSQKKIPLEPAKYYHIYNHANGFENIFYDDDDKILFLDKYKEYISPIAETFTYCLMPNHFHIFLRIKQLEELQNYYIFKNLFAKKQKIAPSEFNRLINNRISQQFSNLFNSYAQLFNNKYNRMGSLFMKNFGRKLVNEHKYFLKIVHYIHYNPVEHGFVNDLSKWKFSSYKSILGKNKTNLLRNEVLEVFGDVKNFVYIHSKPFEM